jgi:hypothetical protein
MLYLVAGDQAALGGDHPPPRQAVTTGEQATDRSGRAGVAGLFGDLPVGGDVAWMKPSKGPSDPPLEVRHEALGTSGGRARKSSTVPTRPRSVTGPITSNRAVSFPAASTTAELTNTSPGLA